MSRLLVAILVFALGIVRNHCSSDSSDDSQQTINHECSTDELAEMHLNASEAVRQHRQRNEERWSTLSDVNHGHTYEWNLRHGTSADRRRLQAQQTNLIINNDNIDIPVIFHLLYDSSNNAQDLVDDYSVYIDRLKNINLNFNEANNDLSDDPNWNDILGNMQMSFFINRIILKDVGNNSPFTWYSNSIKETSSGGNDPIDSDYNLNIWIVRPDAINRFRSAYASFPWDDDTYGIVFNIALVNGDWAGFNWGQYHTIWTHEIGHWVGLYHIWGCCTFNDNPSCNADDDVVDTPNMGNKWGNQCPNDGVNSCAGGEPDQFENFMSYASCINMFTDGQVARARANFMAGGDRETFIDYKTNQAQLSFVNMIYFVGRNEKCMIGNDIKKYIYSNNNGGSYALCVSYSRNPHIYVYNDIKIVTGSTSCPNNYKKIDNNLKNGNNDQDYFVCYRKVAQNNPLSYNTILDVTIIDKNVYIINRYNNYLRDYVYNSISSNNRLTWNQAESRCRSQYGTSLATYKNSIELRRILDLIGSNKVYIGLTHDSSDNQWEFEDGTACLSTNNQLCVNEWATNKPSNNVNDDCTEMTVNDGINNIECGVTYNTVNGYVCNSAQSKGIGITIPVNQYFKIQNVYSGSCIYHNSNGLGYGSCSSTSSQYYWIINDLRYSQSRFRLKNKQTSHCVLNRRYGYFRYPDNWWFTTYYRCLGYADQYWKLFRINGGIFMLRNYHTNACMFQNPDGRFGIAGCNWYYADQFWRIYY